jgi:hypothetical protein
MSPEPWFRCGHERTPYGLFVPEVPTSPSIRPARRQLAAFNLLVLLARTGDRRFFSPLPLQESRCVGQDLPLGLEPVSVGLSADAAMSDPDFVSDPGSSRRLAPIPRALPDLGHRSRRHECGSPGFDPSE